MKSMFVVLYFGAVVKAGPFAGDVAACQRKSDENINSIAASWEKVHGFDPMGITVKCVEQGQLILLGTGIPL